ncbi:hypothetical protein N7457_004175 [Penicillium paradoxum]|uniref:uncharacterized protein n=1 Tax=Penicillium paradoxum TaxID=176176 RepID=UPI002548F60F|nr:uncharacterized protein N7457_004175 [Penicillium paradoxum]KAJ5782401.1 hypothetical protein N7457_004175 [Penicillium paradoxum]
MTSTEKTPASYIGTKLRGMDNYRPWLHQLKLDLSASDPKYWPILMGVDEYPTEPQYHRYTHEQAIATIACSEHIQCEQVTSEQVENLLEQATQENKLLSSEYNARVREWEQLNYQVRSRFGSTLGIVPASHIKGVFGARAAFLVIEYLYADRVAWMGTF